MEDGINEQWERDILSWLLADGYHAAARTRGNIMLERNGWRHHLGQIPIVDQTRHTNTLLKDARLAGQHRLCQNHHQPPMFGL